MGTKSRGRTNAAAPARKTAVVSTGNNQPPHARARLALRELQKHTKHWGKQANGRLLASKSALQVTSEAGTSVPRDPNKYFNHKVSLCCLMVQAHVPLVSPGSPVPSHIRNQEGEVTVPRML